MYNSVALVFIVVAVVLALFDFFYGYKACQKVDSYGHFLGLSGIAAGVVIIAYLFSITTEVYLYTSIASSVYFIGIDWMLVSLAHFAYDFTDSKLVRRSGLVRQFIRVYAIFDSLVLIVNIFREISVHYVLKDTVMISYSYEMKPLYIMHLLFTYFLVLLVVFVLFQKSRKTPRQYRNQYNLNILAIAVVVIINALFLYPHDNSILNTYDFSILGYSLALFLMYWAAFEYKTTDLLESLSMTIFENIDQGIVLFDYNDEIVMYNDKAQRLLEGISFTKNMKCKDFMERCFIPEEIFDRERHSMQSEILGRQGNPLRCDFTRLRDDRGEATGSLFVFTDVSNETDLLTGFQYWDDFKKYAAENPFDFDHPTATVVFDIVGLGEVNRIFGREVGDHRIRNLVKSMQSCMPEGTHFLRGYEAHLGAVCRLYREEDLKGAVERILDANAGTVMYGMSATLDRTESANNTYEDSDSRNVIDALDASMHALQIKKLLSPRSAKSQTLTSLVRALQESDSDTEAHVQRTQKMGEEIGRRIGLNDAQMADLKLLCLLHDIGKIGIPLEILNKPGRLTNEEWNVLKTHPEKGYQIAMSSAEFRSIARMILYHHERWDGQGYPEHLVGNAIPVLSRVISIVDSYDAMVNTRAYRRSMKPEDAKAEIKRCSGTQFDPVIAEEFLKMLDENPEIAVGEKTEDEEIREFMNTVESTHEKGNVFPIKYSRYILNLDEFIIDVDDKFESITGYSRSDVVGKMSQFALIPQEDRAFYMTEVSKQFAAGNTAYLKHEIIRKDDSRIWVICHGKRFYDSAAKAYRSEIFITQTDEEE